VARPDSEGSPNQDKENKMERSRGPEDDAEPEHFY